MRRFLLSAALISTPACLAIAPLEERNEQTAFGGGGSTSDETPTLGGGGTGNGKAAGNGSSNGGSSGNGNGTSCTSPLQCDDGNSCTTDSCDQGFCSNENNTLTCTDDGDECTADFCSGGICTHPATGACDCMASAECDDSNPCTDDACVGNKCDYAHNTAPCPDDDNECTDDICANGICTHPNKAADSPCTDDGDACTKDVCNGAGCTHPANGTCECEDAGDCNDNNPCTNDTCGEDRTCVYDDNSLPCASDNNPCTNDMCVDGTCSHPFNTAPCADESPPKPCTDDVCDNGVCTHVNNTAPCADETPAFSCTDDVCADGLCTHVDNDTCECITVADCDDDNSCTTDSCTTAGVCVNANNSVPCAPGDADADYCTFDICSGGVCTHPDNGACFPDGGLIGTPFTVNNFNSGADWNNRITTPDGRPMTVTGTTDIVNLPDSGYIGVSSNLTIEMDVPSMSGLLLLEILFGTSSGTPAMIDVGLYNGTTWTDRSLGSYSTTPNATITAGTTLSVDTLDFGIPLGQVTKVRIILKPTGGQKVFRLNNIAATN